MISLINDDCSNIHMTMSKYDALITDPPYNISRPNNFKFMKNGRGGRFGMDFGEWDKNFNIVDWIEPAITNLKSGGNVVIFNDWKNLGDISKELERVGCLIKRCLIWKKTNPTPFNRDRLFVNTVEFAVWAVKKGKWTFNRIADNFETGVFEYPSNSRNLHPTQKSLALMENIIKILTNEGDIIYDPFMGSGTTGLAAINNNRKFVGVEDDKKFYKLAQTRLKPFLRTGVLDEIIF